MISVVKLAKVLLLTVLVLSLELNPVWSSNIESDELVNWAARGNFSRIKTLFAEAEHHPERLHKSQRVDTFRACSSIRR